MCSSRKHKIRLDTVHHARLPTGLDSRQRPEELRRRCRDERPINLLQQLATAARSGPLAKFRQQCAALCFRRGKGGLEVLVVTSRNSGRWLIPKGWPIAGKTPWKTAEIEAWEEAGVRGRVSERSVGRYSYLKELDEGKVVPCCVEVYQIDVASVSLQYKERGQRRLEWVSPLEAARRVREVELKSLLGNFDPNARIFKF